MPTDPRRQPQDLIRDGTDLDTHAALLHLGHNVGMARESEAVADALRAEQQGVEQVAVGIGADVERLAAVQQERRPGISAYLHFHAWAGRRTCSTRSACVKRYMFTCRQPTEPQPYPP